jgi:ElaB/YqjD/DUF883 family membrane-anchored ribosome-binding protein
MSARVVLWHQPHLSTKEIAMGTTSMPHGTLGSSLGATAKEKAESLADQLKGMVDAGQERIEGVKGRLLDGKDRVRSQASDTLDRATEAIKAHPLKAVGIAFGVGYVAMRLFR